MTDQERNIYEGESKRKCNLDKGAMPAMKHIYTTSDFIKAKKCSEELVAKWNKQRGYCHECNALKNDYLSARGTSPHFFMLVLMLSPKELEEWDNIKCSECKELTNT